MLVDVVQTVEHAAAVDGTVPLRERADLARVAKVNLTAPALVVALSAADEAPLRVPERGLPIVARIARDVRASSVRRPVCVGEGGGERSAI